MTTLVDLFKEGPVQTFTLDGNSIVGPLSARVRARFEGDQAAPSSFSRPPKKPYRSQRATVEPRTMKVKDAAQYLGISEWTLRRHVHNGELPYLPGKIWRFLIADLDRFLEQTRETKENL